jgi:hypothetical protein
METTMRRYFPILILLLIFGFAAPAMALELQQAKATGLVGEQSSGYLAAVSAPTSEVRALVQSINAKRRASYEKIAAKNGISLQQVEQLAGQKAIEKTRAGQYIRLPSGEWRQR